MITLHPTDYVIYDRANDHVIQWETNGDMVIFGDKAEAEEDCRGRPPAPAAGARCRQDRHAGRAGPEDIH